MIIGTFSLRVILGVILKILKMLAWAAGFLLIASGGMLVFLLSQGFLAQLDYPSYSSDTFVLEPGQKRLEIDVDFGCTDYGIGIKFSPKNREEKRDIKIAFDSDMPPKADIFLFDERGQMIFSKIDFNPVGFYSPIGSYTARIHLERGKYKADIHIKQTAIDLSHLDSKIYISKFAGFLGCKKGFIHDILYWSRVIKYNL